MQPLFLSAGLLSLASLLTAAPTGPWIVPIQDSEDTAFERIDYLNAISNAAMFNNISNGACPNGVPYRRRVEW